MESKICFFLNFDLIFRKRAGTVVGMVSNLAVLISVMLHPFLPAVSKQIREQTNIEKLPLLPEHFIQFLEPGHRIVCGKKGERNRSASESDAR